MAANYVRDYSLVGPNSKAAVEAGLATAEWYHTEIPRKEMKALMQRRDWPAVRDTLIWFALLGGSAAGGLYFWGSWFAVPFFAFYGIMYGSVTDSRWHECSHGTAFKTRWLNSFIYELASFMIMRESETYRWSHARHHTDTLIVGRDPDIAVKRPPNFLLIVLSFFPVVGVYRAYKMMILHASGQLSDDEREFLPEMAYRRVFWTARIWLVIHASIFASAIYFQSFIPLMLVGPLPTIYGGWLARWVDNTQHAGMAENVLDHRLNSRTIYMNRFLRFVYWDMNYHIEHHMFPMVPYHQLEKLHEKIKHDLPETYSNTFEVWREIIPMLKRQVTDPEACVIRTLPETAKTFRPDLHNIFISPRAAAE